MSGVLSEHPGQPSRGANVNEGPHAASKNLADTLPFTDWIFGTLRLPTRMPERYGIDEPTPHGYAGQLAQPFRARTPPAK